MSLRKRDSDDETHLNHVNFQNGLSDLPSQHRRRLKHHHSREQTKIHREMSSSKEVGDVRSEKPEQEEVSFVRLMKSRGSETRCSPGDNPEPRKDEPEDGSSEGEVDDRESCRVDDGEGEGEREPDESVDEKLWDGELEQERRRTSSASRFSWR